MIVDICPHGLTGF